MPDSFIVWHDSISDVTIDLSFLIHIKGRQSIPGIRGDDHLFLLTQKGKISPKGKNYPPSWNTSNLPTNLHSSFILMLGNLEDFDSDGRVSEMSLYLQERNVDHIVIDSSRGHFSDVIFKDYISAVQSEVVGLDKEVWKTLTQVSEDAVQLMW